MEKQDSWKDIRPY